MVCQSLLGKGKESYPTNVSALTLADALIDCRLTVNWSIADVSVTFKPYNVHDVLVVVHCTSL